MFRLTLKNISAKKSRFFLTVDRRHPRRRIHGGHARAHRHDQASPTTTSPATCTKTPTPSCARPPSSLTTNKKESRGTLDAAVLDQVRAVPGVEAADASVVGVAMVVGKDGDLLDASKNRAIPIAMAWQADDRLNPMELVDGHAPAANEIVIDRALRHQGRVRSG